GANVKPCLPPERPFHLRQRSQRACAPCRKRKIKCDGTEPCAACSGYGYNCVYTEAPNRHARASSGVTPPSQMSVTNHDAIKAAAAESGVGWRVSGTAENLYMTSEVIVPDSYGAPKLLQPIKTRFTSAYSAVAWPRRLGIKLGIPNPPRLQAYGWNPGTRKEVNPEMDKTICDILTLSEAKTFADIYFKEVHPYFGILDQSMFNERCEDFWVSMRRGTDFEACICGVIALGSYFSTAKSSHPIPPSPVESAVVEHGRELLDLSVAHPPAMISVKHVAGWILRTLYLRLTTRPHIAWMASCTTVHVAEAIGLHRELDEFQMKPDMPRQITEMEVDLRRRTFWVAMALNQFFASEYGRTMVNIDLISCQTLSPQSGDMTARMVAIMQAAPAQGLLGRPVELFEALVKGTELPVKSPLLGIIRAEVCFCVYRMICSTDTRIRVELIPSLLEVIRVGLDAVTFLGTMHQPWWNVVSMPLQAVGVLLSLETTESYKMIPLALETLKNATTLYDSYLSREALTTAYALVQGAAQQKRSGLDSLDRGLEVVGELSLSTSSLSTSPGDVFQWPMDNDLGYSDFLDLSNYFGLADRAVAGFGL
ncbi:hypothetical protein OIDMADRAFT_108542, partial [Oidiodendron maius Zn]